MLIAKKVRLSLELSPELYDALKALADEGGVSLTTIARQSFALFMVAQKAKKEGKHIGIVSNAAKLDTALVGLF